MAPRSMETSISPAELLAAMKNWPASWASTGEDEPAGRALVAEMEPFVIALVQSGLTRRTFRRHLQYLWAIGGEIVRKFETEPELRRGSAWKLLFDAIDVGEAPLLPDASEAEQEAADATARKLLRFLQKSGTRDLQGQ